MSALRALTAFIVVLGLVSVLVIACGDEEEAVNPDIGKECVVDVDCPGELICGAQNACEMCEPCEVRADCADGYTCDQEAKCCKLVGCSADVDCSQPNYCLELVCREKPCADDTDCTRERHYCDQGSCAEKECAVHTDCTSGLCDLETFTCKTCNIDADCPDPISQICSGGNCEARIQPDGDDNLGELQGCAEFQMGCMYSAMNCFDKINPPQSYASCTIVYELIGEGDEQIENILSYEFIFSDGSVWRTYDVPASSHVARGDAGYCYKIVPEPQFNRLSYYDSQDNFIGSYSIRFDDNAIIITCPDDSKEYYNFNELSTDECAGFQKSGIYSPPTPPGVTACTKVKQGE